jgi:hypothetical protein
LIDHDHGCPQRAEQRQERHMTELSYRSSRPDGWSVPRPHSDPSLRRLKHGPIRPMHQPGLFERLFGRA